MAGFLDTFQAGLNKPGAASFFTNLGAGLLSAGQAAPPGTNRAGLMAPYLQAAAQAPQQAKQQEMAAKVQQLQMAQAMRAEQEANQRNTAQARMRGMLTPWTNPDTGQQSPLRGPFANVAPAKREMALGLMDAGAPAQAASLLFAEPKNRQTITGPDGKPYYVDTQKPVLPGVKSPNEIFMEMIGEGSSVIPVSGEPELRGGGADDRLGNPTLMGGAGNDAVRQPSIRDIWQGLPAEAKAGIMAAPDMQKAFSQYMLQKGGLDIQFGEDGRVTSISQGGQRKGGAGMTPKTRGDIEGKLFAANEQYGRLQNIVSQYEPKFQEIPYRTTMEFAAVRDKFGSLSPEEKQPLEEYASYRRDAIENVNSYIKEITGAQMSKEEAERILKGMPNAGSGIFDGDSPTEFEAKMKSVMSSVKLARARYVYALKNGLDPNSAGSLDGMKGLMSRRAQNLERQVRGANPNASDDDVRKYIKTRLTQEFGI